MNVEELEHRGYWIKSKVSPLHDGSYVCEGSISPQSPEAVARLEPIANLGETRAFPDAAAARAYYLEHAKAWIDRLLARQD